MYPPLMDFCTVFFIDLEQILVPEKVSVSSCLSRPFVTQPFLNNPYFSEFIKEKFRLRDPLFKSQDVFDQKSKLPIPAFFVESANVVIKIYTS